MIDLENDELLPVIEVCQARLGRRISPVTLWRWRLKGVNGSKLECVRVGARWFTTHAAFTQFLREQQPPPAPAEEDSGVRSESMTRRLKAAGLL